MRVDKLKEEDHPEKEIIMSKYNNLAESWDLLSNTIRNKYDFIKESLIDVDVSNGIEDISSKVSNLSTELIDPEHIHDAKHCHQQINKHKSNFAMYKQLEHKFKTLEADAADVGSGNKEALKENLKECKAKMQGLKPLFDKHMESLQESLKFHEMMSELNSELQWIKEKVSKKIVKFIDKT